MCASEEPYSPLVHPHDDGSHDHECDPVTDVVVVAGGATLALARSTSSLNVSSSSSGSSSDAVSTTSSSSGDDKHDSGPHTHAAAAAAGPHVPPRGGFDTAPVADSATGALASALPAAAVVASVAVPTRSQLSSGTGAGVDGSVAPHTHGRRDSGDDSGVVDVSASADTSLRFDVSHMHAALAAVEAARADALRLSVGVTASGNARTTAPYQLSTPARVDSLLLSHKSSLSESLLSQASVAYPSPSRVPELSFSGTGGDHGNGVSTSTHSDGNTSMYGMDRRSPQLDAATLGSFADRLGHVGELIDSFPSRVRSQRPASPPPLPAPAPAVQTLGQQLTQLLSRHDRGGDVSSGSATGTNATGSTGAARQTGWRADAADGALQSVGHRRRGSAGSGVNQSDSFASLEQSFDSPPRVARVVHHHGGLDVHGSGGRSQADANVDGSAGSSAMKVGHNWVPAGVRDYARQRSGSGNSTGSGYSAGGFVPSAGGHDIGSSIGSGNGAGGGDHGVGVDDPVGDILSPIPVAHSESPSASVNQSRVYLDDVPSFVLSPSKAPGMDDDPAGDEHSAPGTSDSLECAAPSRLSGAAVGGRRGGAVGDKYDHKFGDEDEPELVGASRRGDDDGVEEAKMQHRSQELAPRQALARARSGGNVGGDDSRSNSRTRGFRSDDDDDDDGGGGSDNGSLPSIPSPVRLAAALALKGRDGDASSTDGASFSDSLLNSDYSSAGSPSATALGGRYAPSESMSSPKRRGEHRDTSLRTPERRRPGSGGQHPTAAAPSSTTITSASRRIAVYVDPADDDVPRPRTSHGLAAPAVALAPSPTASRDGSDGGGGRGAGRRHAAAHTGVVITPGAGASPTSRAARAVNGASSRRRTKLSSRAALAVVTSGNSGSGGGSPSAVGGAVAGAGAAIVAGGPITGGPITGGPVTPKRLGTPPRSPGRLHVTAGNIVGGIALGRRPPPPPAGSATVL